MRVGVFLNIGCDLYTKMTRRFSPDKIYYMINCTEKDNELSKRLRML